MLSMSQSTMSVEQARKLAGGKRRRTSSKPSKAERIAKLMVLPQVTPTEVAVRDEQRALFERHDKAVVSIRLPLPPSVNAYWRTMVRPGMSIAITYVTQEGHDYHEAVKRLWVRHWNGWPPDPLTGRLRFLMTVVCPDKRRSDIDNRVKQAWDALKECKAICDDFQFDDLRVIRGPVCYPGWVDVTIETISEG